MATFPVDRAMLARAAETLRDHCGVHWVIGGACAGKSTVCEAISARAGIPTFDMDAHIYGAFMVRYTMEDHPASRAWFFAEHPLAWVLSLSEPDFDQLNNEDADRREMKHSVLGLTDGAALWSKFLSFDRLISRTIEDECRQLGIPVYLRHDGLTLDELSKRVLDRFGLAS